MTDLPGDTKARSVGAMFARIVPRYDLMNALMTFGQDHGWRRDTVRLAALPAAGRALDIATGTGEIALEFIRRARPGLVVGVDFCAPMLAVARQKAKLLDRPSVLAFVLGDALHLPFPGDSFDAVTVGFGLRNVADLAAALAELGRVIRPGGRFVSLELTRPASPLVALLFGLYFHQTVPVLGRLITGDPAAYRYLPDSLTHFPRADELAELIRQAGFRRVEVHLRAFGTIALHVAVK
ncbi:MAG: bifunctional demethylmenaquinone methyltransferase/2-methoxy-6-polyprenyl-1,4-benzoquinol methylase UbiE [Chloroflexi bacterium]|nr:bifunctional demethylmenaquinone methyltransferase/2-methoxy-6-polyprenyl-1,4-benzoquinol methylase UbiE [Chloroflexota bacterium]